MTPDVTTYTRDGLVFDVADEGPRAGDVVVLLHGFPQTATSWAKVAPLLHAAGYRTVAPDQRGYSVGARPAGRGAYRLGELVADAVALVDALGPGPVHVVGHDWGAAVAWSLAAAHPERVRTLTAVSVPHPQAMVRAWRTIDQLRRSWYMALFQLPRLPEWLLARPGVARRFLAGVRRDEERLARFHTEMVTTGALTGALNWYRAMPLSNPKGLGRRVRVPTTHVWSDRDHALGRLGAELTAQFVIADYRLEVLSGVSHWIPDEAPAELARIILERVSGDG